MRQRQQQVEARERRLDGFVELRVHGVGGTTPENLLRDPHPVQVAGDSISGFYRRSRPDHLEAYSWGGLTSNPGTRSLWLLVLPFALGNVSGFFLPTGSGKRMAVARALLRLIALGLTALYVLLVGGPALDLIAYQCGGQPLCYQRHWWLAFFENPYFVGHPERRLLVGLVIPALLILAISRITRLTRSRYEAHFAEQEEVESTETPLGDPAATTELEHHAFWHSPRFTARLAGLHVAATLGALAAGTSYSVWRLRGITKEAATTEVTLIAVGVGLTVMAAVGVIWAHLFTNRLVQAMTWTGWILLGLVGATLLGRSGGAEWSAGAHLPGYSKAALLAGFLIFVLSVVLLLALAPDVGRGILGGIGPFVTSALAVLTLGSLVAGIHVRVADWLGDRDPPNDEIATISYADSYGWLAIFTFGLLVLGLVIAVGYWLFTEWRLRRQLPSLQDLFRPRAGAEESRSWLLGIARLHSIRRLVLKADRLLLWIAVLLFVGAVWFFYDRVAHGGSPLAELSDLPNWLSSMIPLATWVMSVLPLIGMAVMYRSYRHAGTRRKVGVLWDIVTFWPRWFHPFAPPPYSAKAVPELSVRVGRLADEGARILLSAHSQGSVVAFAALTRMPERVRRQISLLTHGSPLRRLYGRYFPRFFSEQTLAETAARLDRGRGPCWINLYRETDAIGGAVFAEDHPQHPRAGLDRLLLDPEHGQPALGDPLPPVKGHSGYLDSDPYRTAVNDLSAC